MKVAVVFFALLAAACARNPGHFSSDQWAQVSVQAGRATVVEREYADNQ
jgi:hypothetical protein